MNNQVFQYNGSPITFQIGKATMVNATEMAKPFGKFPWKWLELPSTKEYIRALSENRSLAYNQLVVSVKGGNDTSKRGNWFHEDVALEFARWLSPAFAIWCNDRIKELILNGHVSMCDRSSDFTVCTEHELFELLQDLREAKKRVADLESEIRNYVPGFSSVEQSLPILPVHAIDVCEKCYLTSDIAKKLNISAQSLNRILERKGLLVRDDNESFHISEKYSSCGFYTIKTYTVEGKGYKGKRRIRQMYYPAWTESGRNFILKLVNS